MTPLPPDQIFQTDVAARLQCDPLLSKIGQVREQDGFTEADAQLALGPARAGGVAGAQAGSLIVVQQTTDGSDVKANVPGPMEGFRLTVRVLELPKLARPQAGYISYFVVSARIKALLHLFQLGTAPVLYVRGTPYNDGNGTVGKDLLFSWTPGPQIVQMTAQPTIVADENGMTISSQSEGAVCYFTTDGSYPASSGNAVQNPLPLPAAGTLVRAVAYVADQIPSGVTEKYFA